MLFFIVHLYDGPLRHVVFCHQAFTYTYNTIINIDINKSTRLPNQSLSKVVKKMSFPSLLSCPINTFYLYFVPIYDALFLLLTRSLLVYVTFPPYSSLIKCIVIKICNLPTMSCFFIPVTSITCFGIAWRFCFLFPEKRKT